MNPSKATCLSASWTCTRLFCIGNDAQRNGNKGTEHLDERPLTLLDTKNVLTKLLTSQTVSLYLTRAIGPLSSKKCLNDISWCTVLLYKLRCLCLRSSHIKYCYVILCFSPSFNTPQLCFETIYSNERPVLGSGGILIREGALIKKFHQKGALFREGVAHLNNYGIKFISIKDWKFLIAPTIMSMEA